MSYYYLIFILVLHNELSFTTQQPETKETVHKPKCKNIKCPPIEDPVCVKIKNEKNNKIAFIVAINKCEIQYAKCRQGFDAVIVPMDNCQHDLGNSRKTNSKRIKRETQDKLPDYAVFVSKNSSTENLSKDRVPNFAVFLSKKDENANDEVAKLADDEKGSTANLNQDGGNMSNEANNEVIEEDNEGAIEEDGEEAMGDDNEGVAQEDNEEGAEDDNEKIVEDKNENGDEEDEVEYDQEYEQHYRHSDDEDDKVLNKNDVTDDEGDAKDKEQSHDNEDRENESEKSKDISNLAPDYEQITQDVDYNENKKDCPSVCAARAVMVCAKCQHDIYRTFMSSCHLRQFNCKYPEENLELISRQPCMQSAPYLTNLPGAKGRISEPDDQDHVLKFIHCRDKGKLDDPSCKFDR